jgi:hypothetical protein
MPGTVSIRTATRWSLSRTFALVAIGVTLAACMHSTASYYVPTAGEDRLDENELRVEADRLLSVECERLLTGKTSVSGEGTFVLDFSPTGDVQRSRVSKTTGDKELNDIFGALSAKLHVDAAEPKAGSLRMRAGYICEGDKAITTIELF